MAKRPRATQGVVATTVEPAAGPATEPVDEIGADILEISADEYYDAKRKRDQQAVFFNDGDYEVYTEQEINEMAKRPRVFKEVAATLEEEILKSLNSAVIKANNILQEIFVSDDCVCLTPWAFHGSKLFEYLSVANTRHGSTYAVDSRPGDRDTIGAHIAQALNRHSESEIIHYLSRASAPERPATEISHLCHQKRCQNPRHLTFESHEKNISRIKCHQHAKSWLSCGGIMPLNEFCKEHNPPCLLRQASVTEQEFEIRGWLRARGIASLGEIPAEELGQWANEASEDRFRAIYAIPERRPGDGVITD